MVKKGLGKGLEALLGGAPEETAAGEGVREVQVSRIRANPWQPRNDFDAERLEELAQSIREHGVLQPVLLRQSGPDSYELIAGERRLRAAQQAGLDRIPALVKEYTDPQMLEVALIENVQREDINSLDAARAYQRLSAEFGLSHEEIARRVGKSRTTITNAVRILSLPAEVQEGIRTGRITEGHARSILQVAEALQLSTYLEIQRNGLSVRDAEKLARTRTPDKKRKKDPNTLAIDPETAAIEEALQVALKTKVRVHAQDGSGRIEIEFYSQDELEGLIERLIGG